MTVEDRAASIVAEAEQLISGVQQQLGAQEDFYRQNGIDPAKIAPALESFMGTKEKEVLNKALQADQDAIQQEVAEAAARLRFNSAAPSAPKARRPMV